jgi:hypothetical protein
MTNRKIAIVNNDNVVVAAIAFNVSDIVEQGIVAGLLSDPECFEVSPDSQASIGWKYINGVEYSPEEVARGL